MLFILIMSRLKMKYKSVIVSTICYAGRCRTLNTSSLTPPVILPPVALFWVRKHKYLSRNIPRDILYIIPQVNLLPSRAPITGHILSQPVPHKISRSNSISASVSWRPSRGSPMSRPRSEDPHQC